MNRAFMRSLFSIIILLSFFANPCSTATAAGSDTEAPSPPSSLSVVNTTHTSITIRWAKSTDNGTVKGYQVFRDGKKTTSLSKTEYTIKSLIPGREYVFAVKAYDAAGNLSESSSSLKAKTLEDTRQPTAPGGLCAVSTTHTSISLKWEPSSDNIKLKGYDIYCNNTKKSSSTVEYYVCNGLEPGQVYTFYVKAYDIAGNYSVQSNKISLSTLPDNSPPSVPEGLTATASSETEIKLSWSPSTDNVKVKTYEIYCDGKKKGNISKPEYLCKGLLPGQSYVFTIKALDSKGNGSAPSKPLKAATKSDLKAPSTPADLKVKSVKGSSVALEWTASTDNVKVKGYRIYCNGLEIETASRPSRTVKVPKGIGINILCVKAYDLSGNLSAASKPVVLIG